MALSDTTVPGSVAVAVAVVTMAGLAGGDHRLLCRTSTTHGQVVGVAAVGGDPPERAGRHPPLSYRTVGAWSVDRDRCGGEHRRAGAGGSSRAGRTTVNTIVPPAVAVTPARVALSDTSAPGRLAVAVAVVTIDGMAAPTTDCSSPHADDTARLFCIPR